MSLIRTGVWRKGVWATTVWGQDVWFENPVINRSITARPKFRQTTFGALVKKADSDFNEREVAYEFSNRRQFKSSDRGGGVYE